MSEAVNFDVKFVPAGTGPAVWDDPYANEVVYRFMPLNESIPRCSASSTWVPSAQPHRSCEMSS